MAKQSKNTENIAAPTKESAADVERRIVAVKVFILAQTTGERSAISDVPLHEVILLRRKVPHLGGNKVDLVGEWPSTADRTRGLTVAEVRDEFEKLRNRYTYDKPGGQDGDQVDLVMDVYGPNPRRLVEVMRRTHAAWQKLEATLGDKEPTPEQLEELVALAEPDADYEAIDYTESAPATV